MPRALERRIQRLILSSSIAITLVVTPWSTLDPINVPKFVILGVVAFATAGILAPHFRSVLGHRESKFVYALLIFCAAMFSTIFLSGAGFISQLYGTYGRNTGALTYFALAMMALASFIVAHREFIEKLIWIFIASGTLNSIYGLVQYLRLDPIDWSNPYNPIVGTLGNPNFISAHLGITGLASLAILLSQKGRRKLQMMLLLNIFFSLFVILKSNSSQGLIVFALGSSFVLYRRFIVQRPSITRLIYWGGLLIGLSLVFVGILNRGPLAHLLHQPSVVYRWDYWIAGWVMTWNHPFFGVGLDAYGDWYRVSRTEVAALRRGPDLVSNSAHNVFLDISSNGGMPLLLAYIAILVLVFRAIIRGLRRHRNYDGVFVALTSSWLAYICQSLISINQLGLVTWGWILGGAIVGYDVLESTSNTRKRISSKIFSNNVEIPALTALSGVIGIFFGFILCCWPYVQDFNFRKAIESGDALRIERAALQFPRNIYYLTTAAEIFRENGQNYRAYDLSRKALEVNERDFNSWKILANNEFATAGERKIAIKQLKLLDPYG
jgi:O-antigen ligase